MCVEHIAMTLDGKTMNQVPFKAQEDSLMKRGHWIYTVVHLNTHQIKLRT